MNKAIKDASEDRKFVKTVVKISNMSERLDELRDKAEKAIMKIQEDEKRKKVVGLHDEIVQLKETALPKEEELLKLEEQLQQLAIDSTEVKLLAEELQTIRTKKEEHEAKQEQLLTEFNATLADLDDVEKTLTDITEGIKNREKKGFELEDLEKLKKMNEKVEEVVLNKFNDIAEKAPEGSAQSENVQLQIQRANSLIEKLKVFFFSFYNYDYFFLL